MACHCARNNTVQITVWITVFCYTAAISTGTNDNTTCGEKKIFTELEGQILSPGYPDSYKPGTSCTWTIKVHQGQILALYVNDLDLPQDDPCKDYLSLSEADGEIFRECGNGSYALSSNSNEATVRFHAGGDHGQQGYTGFNFSYTALGCPDAQERKEFQNPVYDYDDLGRRTMTVLCIDGSPLNSTCLTNQWSPPIENLAKICQDAVARTSTTPKVINAAEINGTKVSAFIFYILLLSIVWKLSL